MRTVSFVALAVALLGCILDPEAYLQKQRQARVDKYLLENPNETERVVTAMREGKVFIGMNRAQAAASWGPPQRRNVDLHSSGRTEQWVYGMGHYLYFRDDVLTSISTSR